MNYIEQIMKFKQDFEQSRRVEANEIILKPDIYRKVKDYCLNFCVTVEKVAEEEPAGEKLCGMELKKGNKIHKLLWKNGDNCVISDSPFTVFGGFYKIEENDE